MLIKAGGSECIVLNKQQVFTKSKFKKFILKTILRLTFIKKMTVFREVT